MKRLMKRRATTVPITARQRSGTALIVAIICLTLTSAMTVSLVRLALASHQQTDREGWRLQSAWLAESGLARAAARREHDPGYAGETWMVDELGAPREEGRVMISIIPHPENDSLTLVTATADFPLDPAARIRTTRTLTLLSGEPITAPSPTEE